MPIYSYKCQNCEHRQDELRRIDERDEPLACEKCGKDTKRVQAPFGSYDIKGNNSASTPPKTTVRSRK